MVLTDSSSFLTGHHARSEALFYYFRLEDQVAETHDQQASEDRNPVQQVLGRLQKLGDAGRRDSWTVPKR
jgi:hypothetical protein